MNPVRTKDGSDPIHFGGIDCISMTAAMTGMLRRIALPKIPPHSR